MILLITCMGRASGGDEFPIRKLAGPANKRKNSVIKTCCFCTEFQALAHRDILLHHLDNNDDD